VPSYWKFDCNCRPRTPIKQHIHTFGFDAFIEGVPSTKSWVAIGRAAAIVLLVAKIRSLRSEEANLIENGFEQLNRLL
jgi:hypothetical protein